MESTNTVGGLEEFSLELFFAKHEFTAKYLMCCSDADSMKMKELLALADEECLALWDDLSCCYTEAPGLPTLRREIATDYPGLEEDDIYCFSGAEEGIYTAMRALLTDRDHCVVVTPCYQSLKSVAASICESYTALELQQDAGWVLDMVALAAAIRPNTRMIVMNYPHNPTGALLTPAEQQQVVDLCTKHDLYLFFDEVYRGIEAEGCERLPTLASIYPKGMSLGVVSKALGLAGLRIGWIACQNKEMVSKLSGYKHYLSICNSGPSEVLALIALRNKDAILAKNTAVTRANQALMKEFMQDPIYGGLFSWTPPRGGACGFMGFSQQPNLDWEKAAEVIIESHSVLTLPGKYFSRQSANHFRVGLGRANFPEVLAQFKEAVAALDFAALSK